MHFLFFFNALFHLMMTAVCVQGNGNAVHTNSADSLSNENDVDADEIYVVIKFCF